MRIGILGSGLMGSKLGTILARAGHQVVFSYSRSQAKLQRLAKEAGGRARAGTPAEAVSEADAVLLAVHWSRVDDVLAPAGSLARKTVVTCSLPMTKNDSRMVLGLTTSGAETLAARLRRTNVVSAFSTAPSEVFLSVRESKAEDPAGPCILREPEGREEDRGETDPRCRLQSRRSRGPDGGPLYRAVLTFDRRDRVQRLGARRTRLSL